MRRPSATARSTRADHALDVARREAADALRHGLDGCDATRAQLAEHAARKRARRAARSW